MNRSTDDLDTRTRTGSGSRGNGADPVMAALDVLATALEENAEQERLLAERIKDLAAGRRQGTDWLGLLREEESPGTVHLLSSLLARLSGASGGVRRSLVVALREEGVTIPVIAQLFGVTHQRVSNLLRNAPQVSQN